MDKKTRDRLTELYEDAGFPSFAKFKKAVKKDGLALKDKDVKDFMKDQESFQIFKARGVKQKDFYPIFGYPGTWQADTSFMPKALVRKGAKMKAIMTIINVNTRKAYAIAAKSANAAEMVNLVQKVKDKGEKIHFLGTDLGSEFRSKDFEQEMQEQGIEHFTHESGKKESYDNNHMGKIERLNRTFKDIMLKLLESKKVKYWPGAGH